MLATVLCFREFLFMGKRVALAFATLSSSCIFPTKIKEVGWVGGALPEQELPISFLKANMEVP